MCHTYPTPHPAAVHHTAHQTLTTCLDFRAYRRSVRPTHLVSLLLLMATTARTLFAVARRFPFSHETARRALKANLPSAPALTERLVNGLHHVLAPSRRDRRRRWTLAIDTHHVPYYGTRSTPHIVGGQKKAGTKYFFSYATAVLLHRRRRYTVGLLPLTKTPFPPHRIVTALLGQVRRRGLTVGAVVLDSGFDSGEAILLLRRRGLSYTIPLRRKGSGGNRRNDGFGWARGTVGTVAWVTKKSRKAVATRAPAWRRRGQAETKVYAFGGWGDRRAVTEQRRAWLGRRRYRERFGIETSYRQKNQARAWTTSRDVAYRLLLEGLAHLLRQIWVRRTEQIARARGLKPTAWVGECSLADLLEGIADEVKQAFPQPRPKPPADNTLNPTTAS